MTIQDFLSVQEVTSGLPSFFHTSRCAFQCLYLLCTSVCAPLWRRMCPSKAASRCFLGKMYIQHGGIYHNRWHITGIYLVDGRRRIGVSVYLCMIHVYFSVYMEYLPFFFFSQNILCFPWKSLSDRLHHKITLEKEAARSWAPECALKPFPYPGELAFQWRTVVSTE